MDAQPLLILQNPRGPAPPSLGPAQRALSKLPRNWAACTSCEKIMKGSAARQTREMLQLRRRGRGGGRRRAGGRLGSSSLRSPAPTDGFCSVCKPAI